MFLHPVSTPSPPPPPLWPTPLPPTPLPCKHHLCRLILLLCCLYWGLGGATARAQSDDSDRHDASELTVEIRDRIYKTAGTMEIGLHGGRILNHPYVNPTMVHSTITYYFGRTLGIGLDLTYLINTDKGERLCIENFFNTFNNNTLNLPPCALDKKTPTNPSGDPYIDAAQLLNRHKDAVPAPNMGPAYPPIRELQFIATPSLVWVPYYGKVLLFMSQVMHFNVFLPVGIGITSNRFFPEKKRSSKGVPLRGALPQDDDNNEKNSIGVVADDVAEYGVKGRPQPKDLMTPTFHVGIGVKLHLTQNISLRAEGRSIHLVDGSNGYSLYFSLLGGLGVRF